MRDGIMMPQQSLFNQRPSQSQPRMRIDGPLTTLWKLYRRPRNRQRKLNLPNRRVRPLSQTSAHGTTTTQNLSRGTPSQVLPAMHRVGAITTTDDPEAEDLVVAVGRDLNMTIIMSRLTLVAITQGIMIGDEHTMTEIMTGMLRVSTTTTTTSQRTQSVLTETQTTNGIQTSAATDPGAVAEAVVEVVVVVEDGAEVVAAITKRTTPDTTRATNNLANGARTRTWTSRPSSQPRRKTRRVGFLTPTDSPPLKSKTCAFIE